MVVKIGKRTQPDKSTIIQTTFKMNSRRQKKKSKKNKNNGVVMYRNPPQLQDYGMTHNKTFRFTSTAATPATGTLISYTDLSDFILVASGAVLGHKIFPFVKLRYVEIWDDAPIGTSATITCSLTNTDGNQADPPQTKTDTSMGIHPAHLKIVPKKDSLASKWHGVSGNNCFIIICSAGAIIDVGLSMRQQADVLAVINAQNALVGANIGQIYFRGMDGNAIAGTNFPPPAGISAI